MSFSASALSGASVAPSMMKAELNLTAGPRRNLTSFIFLVVCTTTELILLVVLLHPGIRWFLLSNITRAFRISRCWCLPSIQSAFPGSSIVFLQFPRPTFFTGVTGVGKTVIVLQDLKQHLDAGLSWISNAIETLKLCLLVVSCQEPLY